MFNGTHMIEQIKYQFDNNLLLMPHKWIFEAFEELKSS